MFRWVEKPSSHGPSTRAAPEDVAAFQLLVSHDESPDAAIFEHATGQLRVGDVIAYRMDRRQVRRDLLRGQLHKISYGVLRYGHLAVVVADPVKPTQLRIFSSESLKGPNVDEDLRGLARHDWDAYRLDQHARLDCTRLAEFVSVALERANRLRGYDFSGMLGVWNANLRPRSPEEIGNEYICSSLVATAFYYAGIELDAIRHRALDLLTPLQVVSSRGRVVMLGDVALEIEPDADR
jgi:hypothetical protein